MLSAAAAAASSSAASNASNGAATAASSSNPYSSYWEWEQLAMAATMSGRFGNVAAAQDAQLAAVHQLSAAQQQQSPTSAYYNQMAAAMSAVSATSNPQTAAAAVWYNPQAAAAATYGLNYYGLGGGQRAGTAALSGYLGHYAGYGTPADYYTAGTHFPSYYAAAALSNAAHHQQQQSGLVDPSKSAASFMAHASHQYGVGGHQTQQQQYAGLTGANQLNAIDLQSVVTGSELDSSPLGTRPAPSATPSLINNNVTAQIGQQNGAGAHHGGKEKSKHAEKSSTTTASSKRSKKKKGVAVRSSPAEPNNTRVFVWELMVAIDEALEEDICSILPAHHQCRPGLDQMMANALAKLLQIGFQLDRFEEFDQANVEDAQMDEALQLNAASAGANSISMGGGENSGGQIDGCKNEQRETEDSNANADSGMMGQTPQQMPNKCTQANEGMRRLAAKYQHIKEIYLQHRGVNRFAELLDHCGLNSIEFLTYMDHIERMPGANADLFRQCIRVIAERSMLLPNRCANVVLASGPTEAGIAGALGRLMLCRMAEFIQPENVFCTSRTGKEASMERLANQFQKKLITLITANEESRQLANREGIPCWFLYNDSDLAKFRGALDILIGDILGGGGTQMATGGPSLFVGATIEDQKFGHHEQNQQEGGTVPQFLQAVRG